MRGVYVRKAAKHDEVFGIEDLVFFQVPRSWRDISARFGRATKTRVRVVNADCSGGSGLLDWNVKTRTWSLTDAGRTATREVLAA